MKAALRRDLPIPLYFQIAEILRDDVRERKLHPGDFLTTEEEVERRFDVSRATARHALEELVDEGLVERIPGRGTYIAEPSVRVRPSELKSFTEQIRELEMEPGSKIIDVSVADAPEDVAARLELADGAQALRVERLRLANGKPMLWLLAYMPLDLGFEPSDDLSGSLYEKLEGRGIDIDEAAHVIKPGAADGRVAAQLRLPAGAPILLIQATTFDVAGRPVLYEQAACNGELYRYSIRLKRKPAGAGTTA